VIASGKVVGGRVELDSELPEGASVTVLAFEGDETFEADRETERMLLDSIAQSERGETHPPDATTERSPRPRVSEPLHLEISAHVRTAETGWGLNRPKAPGAFARSLNALPR
jgi:hypothetical protein